MSDSHEHTAGDSALPSFGSLLSAGLIAGVIAAVINGLIWAIAGQDIQVPKQGSASEMMDLALPIVIAASIVPALLASVITKVVVRSRARLGRVFGVYVIFGLLSMAGPLTIKDAPVGDMLVLMSMHVVALVAVITMLRRRY